MTSVDLADLEVKEEEKENNCFSDKRCAVQAS